MEAAIRAIAEPRRREILRLVWTSELAAGEIARHFDVTRPAISQHLRVLKEAGLVSERRSGTRRLYRARPESIAELRTYLESYWDENLRLLKQAAEQEEQQRGSRRDRRHKGN
ncbi:MAG TPA: metalloregulator ArsR/SmtB family transcription factor [Candidatus Limnocylindria bacterium]|nr:metalloregulator ArsR/SmtB family transcription factor [Candidatus Limnocylindria bacterium]